MVGVEIMIKIEKHEQKQLFESLSGIVKTECFNISFQF